MNKTKRKKERKKKHKTGEPDSWMGLSNRIGVLVDIVGFTVVRCCLKTRLPREVEWFVNITEDVVSAVGLACISWLPPLGLVKTDSRSQTSCVRVVQIYEKTKHSSRK